MAQEAYLSRPKCNGAYLVFMGCQEHPANYGFYGTEEYRYGLTNASALPFWAQNFVT